MSVMTWTALQQKALAEPSARAIQVSTGEHFEDVISARGENARVGLTVNR
jgi:hypothetical protein